MHTRAVHERDLLRLDYLMERLGELERRLAPELCAYIAAGCCDALLPLPDPRDDVPRSIMPRSFAVSFDGVCRMDREPGGDVLRLDGVGYLAPEVARGEHEDARAEVFAVGVIAWELLAGRPLFEAATPHQMIELVRSASIPPLASLVPDMDPYLDAIVRTALAVEPADRYESLDAFRDALVQYLSQRNIVIGPAELRGAFADV
jgi:hypothetical protein